jgi:hypothetical protein
LPLVRASRSASFSLLSPRSSQLIYTQLGGTDWGKQLRARFVPILDLFRTFRPSCNTLNGHECFVYSTYAGSSIGSSLPGSLFVPGVEELPPLTFVVPEYTALPSFTVATMPICGGPLLSLSFPFLPSFLLYFT